MIDTSVLDADILDARTAMSNGDWGTAIAKLISARAALMGIPDSEFGGTKFRQDRVQDLDKLLAVCERQGAAVTAAAAETGGIRYTKIVRKQVSAT